MEKGFQYNSAGQTFGISKSEGSQGSWERKFSYKISSTDTQIMLDGCTYPG